jgi:hydroxymethylbilane synthase
VPIRGNVDTRIGRVGEDGYDGVVLAAAGLERLGRGGEISDLLDPNLCVPDAGQGALAVEAREDDSELAGLLAPLNHAATWSTVTAERAFVDATGGGCRVPVAAYAVESEGALEIRTMACLPDGSRIFRSVLEAPIEDPVVAGRAAAKALEATGADEIMYAERIG